MTQVKNQRVLELGAGCGLVGIASGILGAKEVVMTDLPYALPLMRENVARNESAWRKGVGNVEDNCNKCQRIVCEECDWYRPPPINELFNYAPSSNCNNTNTESENGTVYPDLILIADCIWLSPLISPLLRTLKIYAAHSPTKVIITYQKRGRDAHEEFWTGVHDLFEEVAEVDTEGCGGVARPDVLHLLECSGRREDNGEIK